MGTLFANNVNVRIPPHQTASFTTSCQIPHDATLAAMRGEGVTRHVTTVDGSETSAGRVAAVLGLVRSWTTQGGAFGASGADGPVPLG